MKVRALPIKRKIMAVIMLTSITVLALTVTALIAYDLMTFRASMVRSLSTLGRVIADNTAEALDTGQVEDARQTLSTLRNEPQIVTAVLYDTEGNVFASYTNSASTVVLPTSIREQGYFFERGELFLYEPVFENSTRLGTLCLGAKKSFLHRRFKVYLSIAGLIVLGSILVALMLSNSLQRRISDPLLALSGTARQVYQQGDYSVRAPRLSGDELGLLTDAFNQMLTRIQEQTVALQQNEARLRLALSASRTGAWDWNLETNRLVWDDYLCTLFGLKPGGFEGTQEAAMSRVHPEDRRSLEEAIERALGKKAELICEYRAVWPDGSVHHLASRGKAFYSAEGKPARMTGVTQDVTERNQAEEARAFLAAIVDSSDDAIIGKDFAGTVMSWNTGAEHMFGYTAAEMVGQNIDRIIPPDRSGEEELSREQVKRGETRQFETVRTRMDGKSINISLTLSPIRSPQGAIMGMSSISRDITDRIRSQQSLERQSRLLREQAQMLDLANVMARDLEDRIILWNTGMEKMYGWLRTETLGRLSHEVLRTEFPCPLEKILGQVKREGQWEGELIHTCKNGDKLTVSSIWVLHKDDQGRPAAILEVNTDITDRKEAERQILLMNAELERRVQERTAELTSANNELEAFTYSVAHDLRAPLRHIDAFTRILAEDFSANLPAEAQHYLEIVRKGSQNMSRLVDDLLNLARVGRQELKRQTTPLNAIVEEVIADLKRETEHRQVEWRIHPLPAVNGDPGLLKQVFANLLSNAVKYTRPRAKAVIEVGQRRMNDDTVIYVRDNGVGFNMSYADKLFGVFQRLHRAEEFEGTGVGLAIVERVIRRHGGRVWAESAQEQGSTFYLTLNGLDNRRKHA